MEECWHRLSLTTMEKELIDKWYACIFCTTKVLDFIFVE